MTQRVRLRFSIRTLLVAILLFAVLLGFRDVFKIQYHKWAVARAGNKTTSSYPGSYGYHIGKLVELGHFEKRIFELRNLTVESLAARELFRSLVEDNLNVDAMLSMGQYSTNPGEEPKPDNITIECHPDNMYLFEDPILRADQPR